MAWRGKGKKSVSHLAKENECVLNIFRTQTIAMCVLCVNEVGEEWGSAELDERFLDHVRCRGVGRGNRTVHYGLASCWISVLWSKGVCGGALLCGVCLLGDKGALCSVRGGGRKKGLEKSGLIIFICNLVRVRGAWHSVVRSTGVCPGPPG